MKTIELSEAKTQYAISTDQLLINLSFINQNVSYYKRLVNNRKDDSKGIFIPDSYILEQKKSMDSVIGEYISDVEGSDEYKSYLLQHYDESIEEALLKITVE